MPTLSGMQVIHLDDPVMLASGRVPAEFGHFWPWFNLGNHYPSSEGPACTAVCLTAGWPAALAILPE